MRRLLVLFCWLLLHPAALRAGDDTAWRDRVAAEVARLEKGLAELDGTKAEPGTLVIRIEALNARIVKQETLYGIPSGTVTATANLNELTRDAAALGARLAALRKAKAAKEAAKEAAEKPPAPPAPPGSVPPGAPTFQGILAFNSLYPCS